MTLTWLQFSRKYYCKLIKKNLVFQPYINHILIYVFNKQKNVPINVIGIESPVGDVTSGFESATFRVPPRIS